MPLPTVLNSLISRSHRQSSRTAFSIARSDQIESSMTWGDLVHRSLVAARCLSDAGIRRGDRVIVCLPISQDLLSTLFGVLLAGGVCVPSYPLVTGHGLDRWKQQIRTAARVAHVRSAIALPSQRTLVAALLAELREGTLALDPGQLREGAPAEFCAVDPSDLALIQFTSGTTRDPRGTAISHAALAANVSGLVNALALDEDIVSVSWLPPYHDMGLVGHVFAPVVCGAHQVLLPTHQFLSRPVSWLQLISKLRANQTTAPNTGYSICARRIPVEARDGLDLSTLRQALVGAEPVLPDTLDAFSKAFSPCGFSASAFRPVYGLAESTLAVAIAPPGGVRVDRVSRSALTSSGRAVPSESGTDSMQFVRVGHHLPDHELRVVDPLGNPCEPRHVGEILVRGPSLMQSYFNDPAASRDALRDGWLRTGDLGYLADGALHVTGRSKDLVIKGGRNYVPVDIEAACEEDPAIRRGRVVAFGVSNPSTGTEDIVVVAETRRKQSIGSPDLARRLTALVVERVGVRPDHVEVMGPGVLPKTSSGKLQRARIKAAWERGAKLRSQAPGRLMDNQLVELVRGRAIALAELGWSKAREWLNWRQ